MSRHKERVSRHEKKTTIAYLVPVSIALLLIIALNAIIVFQINGTLDKKIKDYEELTRPAKLLITTITADCADCFDVSSIIRAIKTLNVEVDEKSVDLSNAKELIEKYNIKKVPTIIISGEVEKSGLIKLWTSLGTLESDGSLVLRTGSPFVNISTGKVYGRVELIYLNYSLCQNCYDVTEHKNILRNLGLVITKEKNVEANTDEGKALIEKYNITKVPTVLLSPDAKYYITVQSIWNRVGTIESDGWHVFRNMNALRNVTYFDLLANTTKSGK